MSPYTPEDALALEDHPCSCGLCPDSAPTTPGPDTRQRAEEFIRDALGEYAGDFDVPAIADRLYDLAGSWDVGRVDTYDFWTTCKAYDVAAQEASAPRDEARPRPGPCMCRILESAPRDEARPRGYGSLIQISMSAPRDEARP